MPKFFILAMCLFCIAGGAKNALASIYDNQAPIQDKELVSFMRLFPQFRAWAVSNDEEAHPTVKNGKADFLYSDKAAEWVRTRGWEPVRFFAVMGKAAAALAMLEEGSPHNGSRPPDMPPISQEDLRLVRKHLASLIEACSDAPPMN